MRGCGWRERGDCRSSDVWEVELGRTCLTKIFHLRVSTKKNVSTWVYRTVTGVHSEEFPIGIVVSYSIEKAPSCLHF